MQSSQAGWALLQYELMAAGSVMTSCCREKYEFIKCSKTRINFWALAPVKKRLALLPNLLREWGESQCDVAAFKTWWALWFGCQDPQCINFRPIQTIFNKYFFILKGVLFRFIIISLQHLKGFPSDIFVDDQLRSIRFCNKNLIKG